MNYQPVTPADPNLLVVTLDEAKLQLKIDYNCDDSLLIRSLRASQDYAEKFQGRQLLTATYRLLLDCFPQVIHIRKLPVQSVEEIEYLNSSNVLTTLDESAYVVDLYSRPVRIVPAYGTCWPSALDFINSVQVEFVCGYASPAAVPDSTKSAILMQTAWLYQNREPAPYEMDAVNSLLAQDCWGRA